ncbi:hypothetical protein Tco_0068988, partial [Tanacetum coccineum]
TLEDIIFLDYHNPEAIREEEEEKATEAAAMIETEVTLKKVDLEPSRKTKKSRRKLMPTLILMYGCCNIFLQMCSYKVCLATVAAN